jgi:hypothetical protein
LAIAVVVDAIADFFVLGVDRPFTRTPHEVICTLSNSSDACEKAGEEAALFLIFFPIVTRLGGAGAAEVFAANISVKVCASVAVIVDRVGTKFFGGLSICGALRFTVAPVEHVEAVILAGLYAPFASFVGGLLIGCEVAVPLFLFSEAWFSRFRPTRTLDATPQEVLVVAVAILGATEPIGVGLGLADAIGTTRGWGAMEDKGNPDT